MNALRDAMSHAALGWIKPELDETLRQVRGEIEYFVEEPADTSRMRFCAGYLHQVQGTLRMVELYAPAMVAEELELLAIAVQNGQAPDRDEACATLMRGTVLLPDYLERLQDGHRDIPIVLLPLLNEIRAARGEPGLSEGALFALSPDAGTATEAELDHARGSLSGRNRELLDTVGTAIKEELLRVKDALDLHLRTGGDVAALQAQVDELGSVADTLGVMGLGVARGVVVQQRDALRSIVDGQRQADEGLLLDIAGALLYVDASLDDQVAYLGASGGIQDDASAAEARRTVEVLAHEAIANFAAAREHFVAFIETDWEHERLTDVPRLLGEVAGALRMLELPQPADYLEGVRRYVATELIGKRRVPSGRQLDTLADAMASLEYYLEALRERRPGREEILDIARSSLETLRYWPLPSEAPAPQGAVPNPAAAPPAAASAAALPQAPSWDLAPATDALVATGTPPPLSEAPPQAPRWTLDQDSTAAAAQRGGDTGLAADKGARSFDAELAAGSDSASAGLAPISFDPVAAEQEEWHAGTEPLQISVETLALEGDAFRPETAGAAPGETAPHAAAAADDSLAAAGHGFDPVAAESTEPASFGNDDASLVIVDAPAAPADGGHDDVLVIELEDAPAFADPAPDAADAVHSPVWSDAAAPLAAGDAEHAAAAAPGPFVDLAWPAPPVEPEAPVPDVHTASIRPIELDDASAALLAELDAAAARFDLAAADAAASAVDTAGDAAPPVAGLAAAAPAAIDGGFVDGGGDIDADIREVFLEEFDEELVNLGNLLPAWRAAPNRLESLRPIRRVFHTLKGSGRLVGARVLGEFSWKIEGMLNRVLDGARPASPAVVGMVELAYEVLPQLNAALRGHGAIRADLDAMQAVAERIAAGEDAHYFPAAPAPAAAALRAGTPAAVDSVLREILEAEVGTHLETVRDWLQHAPQPASDALLRAVHTMSGAFAMTDVPEITEVTGPAESYVKRLLAAAVVPSAEGVRALDDAARAIAVTIEELQAPSPVIPPFTELAQRLQALAATLPDVQWASVAHDEDDDEPQPRAEAALDPPPLQAVELTAADDLSAYLGDARRLDAAGADTERAAAAAVADTDVPLAAPPVSDAAHAPVPDGHDADGSTEDGIAQNAGGATESDALIAPSADSDSELAAIDADEQALPVQDRKLGESTVDAPLADARVPADSEPPPPPSADAVEEPDAAAGDVGTHHNQPPQDERPQHEPPQHAHDQDPHAAHGRSEHDREPDPHGHAFGTGPVQASTHWHGTAPVSANDAAGPLPAADDDAGLGADAAMHGQDDVDAATALLHDAAADADADAAADADADADAVRTDADAHPAAAEAAAAQHGQAPASHAEVEQTRPAAAAQDTADADADADAVPAAAPHAHAQAHAEQTQARDLAEAAPEAVEHPQADAGAAPDAAVAPLDAVAGGDAHPAPAAEPADTASLALAAVDLGPLDFADLDRELVDIFVDEGRDLLDHCDRLIAELRAAPQDREVLGGLQRDLHTLKGGARMAGVNPIGDLGHGIESLLEAVAAHRTELDRSDVQLLERGFDRLHQLLTLTGKHRAVAMPADLIGRFDARTHGRSLAASVHAAAGPAPLSAPLPADGALEEDSLIARPMQEQVRVRADLLDRLVNHAGEVAIYRSRLEQQLGAFRGAMSELDRTNARLRDQLRRLDLETEAQIVARYQREQDQAEQSFDPLELDRFSTLQQLSRALNESAADLGGLQGVLDDLARQYDGLLQQQSRVSSELQDGLMRARMVPFDGLVPRLRRVVRQAASETGKQVHLTLEGTHGELDRNVLDRMVAPLEHMLRNSVAHGLEAPEQRRAAGKAEEGGIAIRLRREGSEIVLEVADDGAGLDREAIRQRAEQRGLVAAGAALSEEELDALIFAPGFSTYDQVSQLAGRGVGMDVVRNEVRQLGGSVDIHSVWGQGVTFTLRLPQTLAVTQAVFVQIGDTTFAVPVASVSGIGRIGRERFEAADGGYHYSGEEFALHDLGALVGQAPARAEGQMQVPLLLVRAGDLRAAVAIDQVLGNREIVVKPVGLQIASVPGIYGATITGDGRVVVILDMAPLVRRHQTQPPRPVLEAAPAQQRRVPRVMVVDDSLTMRKVTARVLERHNFDVITARDGVEALERLDERVPDLMLLDIEMPRMDGYELATAMRADPRYKAIPIVMITSRSGEKHRQRAFELGVQRYLGKPYQELDLMRNVYDLLGIARVRE
ncbi:Hpt domain-containing protein [Xanthomonas theicola]|uniref:Chemotaxis protein CheA n=1 Tax=Xanthomonas theicola TaxID=56464 RepID=A0A2S6ZGY2_9XANT|nr:Hpt domain-containing protein [Xanthomonas theicola]PPT91513.1 hybrid sensor histidine kinase/response regulator [Xanthomonas theicola]QNH26964.1 response regulator [Xanthomonas theicola]